MISLLLKFICTYQIKPFLTPIKFNLKESVLNHFDGLMYLFLINFSSQSFFLNLTSNIVYTCCYILSGCNGKSFVHFFFDLGIDYEIIF